MFVDIEYSCYDAHDDSQDEDNEAEDGADKPVPAGGVVSPHLMDFEDQIEHQVEKDVNSSYH